MQCKCKCKCGRKEPCPPCFLRRQRHDPSSVQAPATPPRPILLALMQPFVLSLKKLLPRAATAALASFAFPRLGLALGLLASRSCLLALLGRRGLMAAARSPCSKVVVRDQPAAAVSCVDANTTFVQADPATFRALVQKLTGAPPAVVGEKKPQQEEEAVTVPHAPPPRRPKLQERRRAAPARLELARPHPAASPSFYYYHHHHHHHGGGGGGGGGLMMHSPVSPMDAYVLNSLSPSSSMTPSPHSSSSCGVVISREEEEREEKAIASKGFYLHAASPRSAAGDADRPRLLPLFPLHSPRTSASSYAS